MIWYIYLKMISDYSFNETQEDYSWLVDKMVLFLSILFIEILVIPISTTCRLMMESCSKPLSERVRE